eukprot:Skav231868  [mRNA]  locus=scaffold54:16633:30722:- [translate_table: standard]
MTPPAAVRDESPKTPSFKPSLPKLRISQSGIAQSETEKIAAEKNQVDEVDRVDESSDQHDSASGTCSETETPSSPCSVEDPKSEESEESEELESKREGAGYGIPFWPVYYPRYQHGYQHWWDISEMTDRHLEACQKIALKRAELRGAPRGDHCSVGCCCSRCIGFPAAFYPKKKLEQQSQLNKSEEKKPKEQGIAADDENRGKDCDTISVQESLEETNSSKSSTSVSNSSDSDMDVEDILRQLPSQVWTTTDPLLQKNLLGPRLKRTVVCANLHPDATAEDVQQAFEHRFLSLPGVTCSAVLTVRIDSSFKVSATSSIRAFVILFDEKLANTALLFEGLDICGRRLRLRRPRECSESSSEAFDVSTLYRLGMLSRKCSVSAKDRRAMASFWQYPDKKVSSSWVSPIITQGGAGRRKRISNVGSANGDAATTWWENWEWPRAVATSPCMQPTTYFYFRMLWTLIFLSADTFDPRAELQRFTGCVSGEDVDGTVVLFPARGAAPAADLGTAPRRIVVLDGGAALKCKILLPSWRIVYADVQNASD